MREARVSQLAEIYVEDDEFMLRVLRIADAQYVSALGTFMLGLLLAEFGGTAVLKLQTAERRFVVSSP